MRRLLALGSAAAVVAAPALAEGNRVVATSYVEDRSYFVGDDCSSTDTVLVRLPRGAFRVRAVQPRVGDELKDGDSRVVSEITAFRKVTTDKGVYAEWTAKGAGAVCSNPGVFGAGWATPELPFRARYTSRERVYFSGSLDSLRYRPKKIYFGNTRPITGLRWWRWGHRAARGRGVFHYNDCDPSCAAGHYTSYRVILRLKRIRRCDGRLQYLDLVWRYVGSKPPGPGSRKSSFGWKCDEVPGRRASRSF